MIMLRGAFLITHSELILFGLDHISIDMNKSFSSYGKDTNNHTIVIYLLKEKVYVCPHCNSKSIISRGSKSCLIKYSSTTIDNINVKLYRRYFKCNNCYKTFHETCDFLATSRAMSLSKETRILQALKEINATYKSVANRFDVSTTYVAKLFDYKIDIKRLRMPKVLCVDEVYAKRLSYHKYCFILYSPQLKKIVDVLDSRRQSNLDDYFTTFQSKNAIWLNIFLSIYMNHIV